MAEKILISAAEMEVAIGKYNEVKNNKMAAIEQMAQAVNALDGSYDGPASEIFMGAFKLLHANLKNSELIMADAVDTLQKVVDDLIQAEGDTVSDTFNAILGEGPAPTI